MLFYACDIIVYTRNVCAQVPLGDWTFNPELRGAANGLIIPSGIRERERRDRCHFLYFLSEETGAQGDLVEGLRAQNDFRVGIQNHLVKDHQA